MSTIRPVITRENMPNVLLLEQTPDIRDKYCVICPKGGYNFEDMDNHYDRYHNCYLVEETTYGGGEDYPIDIGSKSDVPHEKSYSKSTARLLGDSSDSSTSGASSGQRKSKKSASQRFSRKFDNKLNQFKAETSQQLEDQMSMIKSEITTKSNLSDTALETIKEGIISNTVQMSSVSNNLTITSERMENFMKSQIDNSDKLEKLLQSHIDLQKDNKSLREEMAIIHAQPNISQSENVHQPSASGHEEGSSNENISIKENLCLVTNNEIRHSESDIQIQSNKVMQAINIQDTEVNSINNISTIRSISNKNKRPSTLSKKLRTKRLSTQRSFPRKMMLKPEEEVTTAPVEKEVTTAPVEKEVTTAPAEEEVTTAPVEKENTSKYRVFYFLIACIQLLNTIF